MRKTFLLLAVFAGVSGTARAQSKVSVGFKAGPSYTNLASNSNVYHGGSGYKMGFHGGIMADVSVTNNLSIHPELLYSLKGHQTQLYGTYPLDLRLRYLDLPLLLRYYASGLYVEAGPQVSLLLSAEEGNSDQKTKYTNTTIGYGTGLGYRLESGLSLGLRYSSDFTNIIKAKEDSPSLLNEKNRAFMLSLGYSFGGQ
jgi:hypothetical protein